MKEIKLHLLDKDEATRLLRGQTLSIEGEHPFMIGLLADALAALDNGHAPRRAANGVGRGRWGKNKCRFKDCTRSFRSRKRLVAHKMADHGYKASNQYRKKA